MPGWIGEDDAVLGVGLEVVLRRAGGQHPGFGGGAVIDEEVQVHLDGHRGVRPRRTPWIRIRYFIGAPLSAGPGPLWHPSLGTSELLQHSRHCSEVS